MLSWALMVALQGWTGINGCQEIQFPDRTIRCLGVIAFGFHWAYRRVTQDPNSVGRAVFVSTGNALRREVSYGISGPGFFLECGAVFSEITVTTLVYLLNGVRCCSIIVKAIILPLVDLPLVDLI